MRRHPLWLPLVALPLVALALVACRAAPPSAGDANAPGVVAKRAGGAEELTGKLVFDPACSDFANAQDQVVCLTNTGAARVDLSDWLIRTALGRTYYFPAGTAIEPGKSLKVHTGAGTNDAQNLYWNYAFKPVFDKKEQIILVSKGNVDIATMTTP